MLVKLLGLKISIRAMGNIIYDEDIKVIAMSNHKNTLRDNKSYKIL